MVPQFWHCISLDETVLVGFGPGAMSAYCVPVLALLAAIVAAAAAACAALATRLLNAGHPLQLELPPVPSQCPSPGHVPRPETEDTEMTWVRSAGAISGFTVWTTISLGAVEGALELRRLMPGGRGTWRAFSYNPQALQMIFPLISRRHRGVVVVPQFLCTQ